MVYLGIENEVKHTLCQLCHADYLSVKSLAEQKNKTVEQYVFDLLMTDLDKLKKKKNNFLSVV